MSVAAWAAVALLLGFACWTDIRRMVIPNGLTVTFAIGGLLYHGAAEGMSGLGYAAVGGAAGMLPMLLMFALRGIGGGDVKWFAAFGTWSGAWAALQLVAASILCAGIVAVLLLTLRLPVIRRRAPAAKWPWEQESNREPVRPTESREGGPPRIGTTFPFMIAVAPAAVWLAWHML